MAGSYVPSPNNTELYASVFFLFVPNNFKFVVIVKGFAGSAVRFTVQKDFASYGFTVEAGN
jgi:hypothetical protein